MPESARPARSTGGGLRRFLYGGRRVRSADTFGIAAGLGLLFGFGEYVAWKLRLAIDGLFLHWSNPDTVWAAPLVLMAVALTAALPLAVAAARSERGIGAGAVFAIVGSLTLFAFIRSLRTGLHPLAVLVVCAGVMVTLRDRLASRAPAGARLRRTVGAVATGLLIVGATMVVGRAVRERSLIAGLPAAPAGAANVVFIILDTVRAESLGLYGYARPTTPRVDAIAARGLVFDRAITHAPWTLPAHASLFTGVLPWQHLADWRTPLDDRYATLAEYLAGHGWVTGGFTGNLTYTTRRSGLARGFIHYDDYGIDPRSVLGSEWFGARLARALATVSGASRLDRKPAAEVREDALAWVTGVDRPFFAFLNFFDAHAPYETCGAFEDVARGRPVDERIPDRAGQWTERRPGLIAERDRYDAAIGCIDAEVGRFVDGLDAAGLLGSTLIVIASDHGEHFGEHGLIDHGNSLFDELLHVPLVLSGPGIGTPGRIRGTVGLRDLPATVVTYLGLEAGSPFEGRSLIDRTRRADTTLAEFVTSQVTPEIGAPAIGPLARGAAMGISWNQHRFIRLGDGSEALFDLRSDPDETRNVAMTPEFLATARSLGQRVDSLLATVPPPAVGHE